MMASSSSTTEDDPNALTKERMDTALSLLDAEVAKSEILMAIAPICLVSIGGSLAVQLCRNRNSTFDIDCLLDPSIASTPERLNEFSRAVARVAVDGGLGPNWLNQQVEMFVARARRQDLFADSVAQGMRVFTGTNVVIYAGRLDWALERKLRRVAWARERRARKAVDVPDAAALVRLIRETGLGAGDGIGSASGSSNGSLDEATSTTTTATAPLSFSFVRDLNFNGFDVPPTDEAIKEVAEHYAKTYGEVGIADLVWDPEKSRHKYRDINGEWAWI